MTWLDYILNIIILKCTMTLNWLSYRLLEMCSSICVFIWKLVGRIQFGVFFLEGSDGDWDTHRLWSIWLSSPSSSYHNYIVSHPVITTGIFSYRIEGVHHWLTLIIEVNMTFTKTHKCGYSGQADLLFFHFVNHRNGASYLQSLLRVNAIARYKP